MPRPAPPKTSRVVTANAWRRSLCVTEMTTAGTPATRRNARPPPAASTSSAATTRSASLPCGAVTVTQTVRTNQTSPWSAAAAGRSPRNLAAQWASSSAAAESASTWTGSATATQIARINQMKQTVVSLFFSFKVLFVLSFSLVPYTLLLLKAIRKQAKESYHFISQKHCRLLQKTMRTAWLWSAWGECYWVNCSRLRMHFC